MSIPATKGKMTHACEASLAQALANPAKFAQWVARVMAIALAGEDVNAEVVAGRSALDLFYECQLASEQDKANAARLIKRGARIIGADPAHVRRVLREEILGGEAIRLGAHIEAGADVECAKARAETLLMFAATKGPPNGVAVVETLLRLGADPRRKGPGGRTALELATACGRFELAALIEAAELRQALEGAAPQQPAGASAVAVAAAEPLAATAVSLGSPVSETSPEPLAEPPAPPRSRKPRL